ncbi:MAG TPA: PPOX class F420-dependent oxidoreductase [Acidimicrobiales bacterium]
MAVSLPETARTAIISGRHAHLVTVNEDGSPQVTLIWVGLEGDEIVSGHLAKRKKVRNILRDPRVVMSMETGGHDERSLDNYLVVAGQARVTEGGAPELLQRLAQVYMGPDVRFPDMENPPPGYVIHIVPDKVGGVGPW